MKDIIIKSFTLILGFGLITYVAWLISQGAIVTGESGPMNMVLLIVCGIIALYLVAINFVITWIPNNRWTLGIFGIIMIIASHQILVDNADAQVYLRDIMKLIGVFFVIVGPTKLLINEKKRQKIEEEQMEVIEV